MGRTLMDKMNKQPISCKQMMLDSTNELRNLLGSVSPEASDKREDFEASICLATRSAFFDFNTWVVLYGVIDDDGAKELRELLERAHQHLTIAKFSDSVKRRLEELELKCRQVREQHSTSCHSSSNVSREPNDWPPKN